MIWNRKLYLVLYVVVNTSGIPSIRVSTDDIEAIVVNVGVNNNDQFSCLPKSSSTC